MPVSASSCYGMHVSQFFFLLAELCQAYTLWSDCSLVGISPIVLSVCYQASNQVMKSRSSAFAKTLNIYLHTWAVNFHTAPTSLSSCSQWAPRQYCRTCSTAEHINSGTRESLELPSLIGQWAHALPPLSPTTSLCGRSFSSRWLCMMIGVHISTLPSMLGWQVCFHRSQYQLACFFI